jgi:hypothetical protein
MRGEMASPQRRGAAVDFVTSAERPFWLIGFADHEVRTDSARQDWRACKSGQLQLSPAAIAWDIADIQAVLLTLAKDRTDSLDLAPVPIALFNVRKGIRIKAG